MLLCFLRDTSPRKDPQCQTTVADLPPRLAGQNPLTPVHRATPCCCEAHHASPPKFSHAPNSKTQAGAPGAPTPAGSGRSGARAPRAGGPVCCHRQRPVAAPSSAWAKSQLARRCLPATFDHLMLAQGQNAQQLTDLPQGPAAPGWGRAVSMGLRMALAAAEAQGRACSHSYIWKPSTVT
eukprot:COSAG06_NODE_5601_length_3368_cov_117.163965_3_plen_180_part_00